MAEHAIDLDRMARIYSETPEKLSDAELKRFVGAIVRASKQAVGMEERQAPACYLSLREVENSLARRMWAGVGRAGLAEQARRGQTNKRSIGFGPRRERVAASLRAAFFTGKLTLYVAADEARFRERFNGIPSWAKDPMPVPKELLGNLFVKDGRGRLPATFAIRPSRKLAGNDKLFALLNCGYLVVRERDFRRWLRSERRRRRWPSQNRSDVQTRPVGRPNMVNPRLRNAILEIARDQVWTGDRLPITSLHCLLNDKGLDVPSVDTIARIVDELFAVTGAPELRRRRRIRRR